MPYTVAVMHNIPLTVLVVYALLYLYHNISNHYTVLYALKFKKEVGIDYIYKK